MGLERSLVDNPTGSIWFLRDRIFPTHQLFDNLFSCLCIDFSLSWQLKRDSELVQADHVRDSLLELTKNPSEKWPDSSGNGAGFDSNHHLHSHLFGSHHRLKK